MTTPAPRTSNAKAILVTMFGGSQALLVGFVAHVMEGVAKKQAILDRHKELGPLARPALEQRQYRWPDRSGQHRRACCYS